MDESFADLSIIGDNFNTTEDVLPFFDSLAENTIKGYALSSVYGGGTPNSEYEFLSGNSLAFLPTGAIVYQQYIKSNSYSMLSNLKQLGYSCYATHPYLSSGWMRSTVYPLLGFDTFTFLDDYPQQNLVRDYVSDQEMFDYIIRLYENNIEMNSHQFIFGVTMQNHSGYDYTGDNFTETIKLKCYTNAYADVEQYINLIHETDTALHNLVDYLSTIDSPILLVFYGDHWPGLNTDFYEEVHGSALTSLNETIYEYTVPFFIWANYDIDEQYVNLTSLNYLSNYVYNAAGIALPAYNQQLAQIQQHIPAINSQGYYSMDNGSFIPIDDATGEEAYWLNFYNQLEYNCMFDSEHRSNILFPTS